MTPLVMRMIMLCLKNEPSNKFKVEFAILKLSYCYVFYFLLTNQAYLCFAVYKQVASYARSTLGADSAGDAKVSR